MNVELSEQDVQNLLVALNSIPVQGEDKMVAVLTLARKLRAVLQLPIPVPDAPAEE